MTAADIISYIPLMVGGVVLVVGISIGGWVMNTRLRIKHGYPLESMWGMPIHPKTDAEAQERMKLVTQENVLSAPSSARSRTASPWSSGS